MKFRLLLTAIAFLSGGMASGAEEAKASPPNILFVIADDWSHPHAGAYGCSWVKTPAFDRVAREGLLFANAYTPNSKCAPSRACVLTGRNPWQLKAACNHNAYFPVEFATFPEALARHGYFSGMTGKGWGPGVANGAEGKPRQMTGRPFNARKAPPPAKGMSNNDYAANFAEFLDAAPGGGPWLFWAGSTEPHRDYELGSGVKAGRKLVGIDAIPACWPDNETIRNDLLDYALEVEHFDLHLARMLAELERRGQLENTLVIVTSDNAMPFPGFKGNLSRQATHLPLAAMWKRGVRAPGRVITDFVSFIDLAPTIVELAGVAWDKTGMAPAGGRSFTDIFASDKAGRVNPARDHVLLGQERHDVGRPHDWGYPARGITSDDWAYVHNFEPTRWPAGNPETGYLNTDGSPTKTHILNAHRANAADPHWAACFGLRPGEELYDLKADPACLRNLASQADQAQTRDRLKKQLFAELTAQGDPRMAGNGGVFEGEPYAAPAQRGFYERHRAGEKIKAGWVNETDFEKEPVK